MAPALHSRDLAAPRATAARAAAAAAAAVALLLLAAAARCPRPCGPAGAAAADARREPHPLDGWALPARGPEPGDARAALAASPTTLARSGDWVAVAWSGVRRPSRSDAVAVYADGADPAAAAPLKWVPCAAASWASHLALGRGRARLRLLNVRRPLRLALVRGAPGARRVAAWAPPLRFASWDEPTAGRLTPTGVRGQVAVQWTTAGAARPTVRWGTAPGAYDSSAAADTTTLTAADMCGAPANSTGWLDPGRLHLAVLTGLRPGTRYWYRYGDAAAAAGGPGWSDEASFATPAAYPPAAAPSPGREGEGEGGGGGEGGGEEEETRLLLVADLGYAEADGSEGGPPAAAAAATAARLAADTHPGGAFRATLVALPGDLSYARGYAAQWEAFFDAVGPALRAAPLASAPGNHEVDWPSARGGDDDDDDPPPRGGRFRNRTDSGGECGAAYAARARMPAPGGRRPWWSHAWGPLHIVYLSSEHAFGPGSEQAAFLEADLAAVDRGRTPWVAVALHRPPVVDSGWGSAPDSDLAVAAALRAALEPALLRHGVDVVWAGHHHSYQRTCPYAAGACAAAPARGGGAAAAGRAAPAAAAAGRRLLRGGGTGGAPPPPDVYAAPAGAPVYVVAGHGGFQLTPVLAAAPPPGFAAVQLRHGYVRVRATGARLTHTAIASDDGSVMDEFVLVKRGGPPRRGGGARPAAAAA